jgi:glycosyltransferase involved in cell wall biosynthesis
MYALGSGYGAIGIPYRIVYSLRQQFDLIHAFDHKPNVLLPAILHNKMKQTPLVADWSDWWGRTADGSGLQEHKTRPVVGLETFMEEYIHAEADWVTTISTGLRQRAISLGIPPGRISCIPSGAPDDLIVPLDKASCREELQISPTAFLVGYVGIGIEDLEMIADALLLLRKARREVSLGIIGPIGENTRLDEPQLREAIVPFGRVPFHKLPLYLGACDAYVLPMRNSVVNRTRWPNKFGDYLAGGRPVLCSNVGDVATIVRSEECGFVWNNIHELCQGIEILMEDASLASRMGERARQLAEGRLSWQRLASEFAEVYRKVCA